jgi:LPPG:FO 2-phospho-L-lactate transferase
VEDARLTPEVATALQDARIVIVCPSNPVLSIAPILAVPGVRELIENRKGQCVAVSPFIGGQAVKGPAAKLMGEMGLDISVHGLIRTYDGLLDGLIIDHEDHDQIQAGEPIRVRATQTLMQTADDKIRLARECLEWGGNWNT